MLQKGASYAPKAPAPITQQIIHSGAGNVAAPIVNTARSLGSTGYHVAGIPFNETRAAIGQITGNHAAAASGQRQANQGFSSLRELAQGTAAQAYQLGESLNPAGGDVYNRQHTPGNKVEKFLLGKDSIPSMQKAYKDTKAQKGTAQAVSGTVLTALMDVAGGRSAAKVAPKIPGVRQAATATKTASKTVAKAATPPKISPEQLAQRNKLVVAYNNAKGKDPGLTDYLGKQIDSIDQTVSGGFVRLPIPERNFRKNAKEAYKAVSGQKEVANLKASDTPNLVKFSKEVHDQLLAKHPDIANRNFNSTLGYIKTLSIPDGVLKDTPANRTNYVRQVANKINKVGVKPTNPDGTARLTTSFLIKRPRELSTGLANPKAEPVSHLPFKEGDVARVSSSSTTLPNIVPPKDVKVNGSPAQTRTGSFGLERRAESVPRESKSIIPAAIQSEEQMARFMQHINSVPTRELENTPQRTAVPAPKTPYRANLADQSPASIKQLIENRTPGQAQSRGQGPNIPSQTSSNTTPLPKEYVHNRTSTLDLAARSTRSIIERQGEHGKKLADMLQDQRDTKELYLRDLEKQLPTVKSLKGKDFENFVEATQDREIPKNPKVQQAINEWQAVHPTIRNRAVNAGLDVGDLGPTYYPHFVDYEKLFKNQNEYNKAINHIVDTGQAAIHEEAIKLLGFARDVSRNRRFGNLEASRVVDVPQYDKTPNSLASYLNSSADRITKTETFGAGDENALKLIVKAGKQGYDTEAMKNAYDVAAGAKQYNPNVSKTLGTVRKYTTTTRLGLGAITNSSQSVNTGIVTGHLRTLRAITKQLDPKTRAWAEDTGVISDAVISDLKEGAGFTGKVLGKITAPGFGAVEKFNRRVAATAGRDYALRLAQKGDKATLRKLGVKGNINGKTLTEDQQVQAARKIVEKTQFKVDPQDLPGWANSPGGKLVAQFRTFSYNQGKFFSNEVLKPMGKGNYLPLGRLLAALPVGYAIYETKAKISGRPPEANKVREAADIFGNIGGAGLTLDIYRGLFPLGGKYIPPDRRIAMATGTFGGPSIGTTANVVSAGSELTQLKNVPKKGTAGKLAIPAPAGDKGPRYIDATSAARLGLQQIPIVGTPIANRTLPYTTAQKPVSVTPKASAASASSTVNDKNSILASFSPDAQKFLKLTPAEQNAAIAQNPDLKSVRDRFNTAQTVYKAKDSITAKLPTGLSKSSQDTLIKQEQMTSAAKDRLIKTDPSAEYRIAQAKYEKDKLSGTLSTVEDIRRNNELEKLKAGSTFSKDTRELYSLNKTDLYNYLTKAPNGQKIANDLVAYDDKLVSSGVIDTHKLRDKNGNVSITPKAKAVAKAKKAPKLSFKSFTNSHIKAPAPPKTKTTTSYKKTSLKKYALGKGPKIKASKISTRKLA